MIVGVVEERLELFPGERAVTGAALVVSQVLAGIPLGADLHGVGAEAVLALELPAVAEVAQVVEEGRNPALVGPDGGVAHWPGAG